MTFVEILRTMYPQDKANHFMRGSVCGAVGAVAGMLLAIMLWKWLWPPALLAMPLLAAIGCTVAAYAAGFWKERADARANAAAYADWLVTDQAQPFVAPHGVETADWQFTTWGAVPVAVPLVALALISMI